MIYNSDYQNSGWILLQKFFPESSIQASLDWLTKARENTTHNSSLEPEFEKFGLSYHRHVRKIRRLLWNDLPFWSNLLSQSGVFELGSQFISGKPAIIRHAAFLKPRYVGSKVELHQDQALWEHDYPGAISMWIALSSSHNQNGCLEIYPGSHLEGLRSHQKTIEYSWHAHIHPDNSELCKPKKIQMQAGDILIWHRYLVHGSGPNYSGDSREGMVLVFANTSIPNFQSRDILEI